LEPHGHSLETFVVLHRDDASIKLSRGLLRRQPNVIVVFERQSRAKNRVLRTAVLHNHTFVELHISRARRGQTCRNSHRLNCTEETRELFYTALVAFRDRRFADLSHATR
jgi:hypothetical protein